MIHDGYELDRQSKISFLVNEKKAGKPVPELHVCWESSGGGNCCRCEKCYRTILAIASEGGDPREFGFNWSPEDADNLKERFDKLDILVSKTQLERYYIPMQKIIGKNSKVIRGLDRYSWFASYDLEEYSRLLTAKIKKQCSHPRIKGILKKLKLMH